MITNNELEKIAKETLLEEANAIISFVNNDFNFNFLRAVKLLHECKGKILFSGIGKSGIIAQKIVATFNSIGKTSIFIHPIEALHGDMGIIGNEDIIVVISKSGETEELFTLLKFIIKKGIKIISIVGNQDSKIASISEVVINFNIKKEAPPLGIAPTTSTTLTLAIGDAFAACLIKLQGIKLEDFARFHPGGAIGKAYYLRVKDIMHSGDENPQLPPDSSMEEVIYEVTKKQMGAVNIVDKDNKLLGIITDGDIRRALIKKDKFFNFVANDIMTKKPVVIYENDLAIKAIDLIENRPSQIPVLPVVNDNFENVGILRIHDLVKAGL